MQLFPQALPFLQTLQHAPLGSTDHSSASSAELGGGLASGVLELVVERESVSSAARARLRANLITVR